MLRTLIIDDNPLFLTSLSQLLGLFPGVSVVAVACDGEEGLRVAAEVVPDLVFVDLHMPGLGGLEVATQLRQSRPQTRVVVMSWHEDSEYRKRVAAVGAERFVCKGNLLTKLPVIVSGPIATSPTVRGAK